MYELDSYELAEWQAFEILEPWGEKRADLRMGITSAVIANCNIAKGKPKVSPTDFMPVFGPTPKQSPDTMKKLLMGLVEATKNNKKVPKQ